jgi:hypothetical protein
MTNTTKREIKALILANYATYLATLSASEQARFVEFVWGDFVAGHGSACNGGDAYGDVR